MVPVASSVDAALPASAVPSLVASNVLLVLFLLIPIVVGLAMIHEGGTQFRLRQRVRDTPTETARSVAVGRTAVTGVARPAAATCRAPFTGKKCLYVQWQVSERSETADSGWELLDFGVEVSPFSLTDGTGRILVDPSHQSVTSPTVLDETSGIEVREEDSTTTVVEGGTEPPEPIASFLSGDREVGIERIDAGDVPAFGDDRPASLGTGGLLGQGNREDSPATEQLQPFDGMLDDNVPVTSTRDRKYEQRVLPVGVEVYVFGRATPMEGADCDALVVGPDPDTDMFLVSSDGETELVPQFKRSARFLITVGLLMSSVGLGAVLLLVGP